MRTDVPLAGGIDDDGGVTDQRTVDVHGGDPAEGYRLLIAAEEAGHFQCDPLLVNDHLRGKDAVAFRETCSDECFHGDAR